MRTCSRRSMDRTLACGAGNIGSIPIESTTMEEDKYAANIVKEYRYWTVYVNEDQGFLGRCVVWCRREDALDLALSTPEEQKELFDILPAVRSALAQSFGATWFNYSFLGNVDRHLHCHLFPRYQSPVSFNGTVFTDLNYNENPSKTGTTNKVSKEMLGAIRATLAKVL